MAYRRGMTDIVRRRPDGPEQPLSRADLDPDPVLQLGRWLEAAAAAGMREPNAMTLATADASGVPSARVVLLRGLDASGLTWYTNRGSLKGRDLAANPRAAVVFHWELQQRQVRVAGDVTAIAETEAAAYFADRPRRSQLSAWASPQGQPIAERGRARGRHRSHRRAISGDGAAASVLGWLPADACDVRVLARATRPHARPLPLPACSAGMADRPPRALAGRGRPQP